MNRLLVSLIFSTSVPLFLTVVPSTGSPEVLDEDSADWPAEYVSNSPYWGDFKNNEYHNYYWGYNTHNERLLYHSRVNKVGRLWTIVSEDVGFPAKYQIPKGTISYIQILDQKPIGKGGYAFFLRGGLGSNNVTIRFVSQRNFGYDFIVKIYGH